MNNCPSWQKQRIFSQFKSNEWPQLYKTAVVVSEDNQSEEDINVHKKYHLHLMYPFSEGCNKIIIEKKKKQIPNAY